MIIYNKQEGYIALTTVLIVGLVSSVIMVSLLSLGMSYTRSSASSSASAQARSLATACSEEGLRQLRANGNFTATNTAVVLGAGTCTYSVVNTGGTTRQIDARGDVGTVTRKQQVNVSALNPTIIISSWQDVQ